MENLLFLQLLEHPAKKSRTIKQRKNPFDNFNWVELTMHFRWVKTTVHKLLKTETADTDYSKVCSNRDSYRKTIITALLADPSLPLGGNNWPWPIAPSRSLLSESILAGLYRANPTPALPSHGRASAALIVSQWYPITQCCQYMQT